MSEQEQITHFGNELDTLINRFRDEYEMSYAAVVGCLEFRKFTLMVESMNNNEENDNG